MCKIPKKKITSKLSSFICVTLCIIVCLSLTACGSSKKYVGHGFKYMHGYSSTDFSDYMVYSENSKLAGLDKKASLIIENEKDMPRLDGAEACYPLYAAYAKAVYKDIDLIEKKWTETAKDQSCNGKIVTFTNSISGFTRFVRGGKASGNKGDSEASGNISDNEAIEDFGGGVDIFFGAKPSDSQLFFAKESKVEIEVTPIAREAFVFFVEADNPVENLTSDQFRAIYHGDIKNWKEVGGKNQAIVPFQRPSNSGSQTMMEYFMGNVSLMEPKTYQIVDAMTGVIDRVAEYANENGALGYSFRYFLEELNQEKGVKMLSIDGVYPSLENIENGTYPLTTNVCAITRKGDANPYVQKMIDYILSEEGQEIVEKTGYAKLRK